MRREGRRTEDFFNRCRLPMLKWAEIAFCSKLLPVKSWSISCTSHLLPLSPSPYQIGPRLSEGKMTGSSLQCWVSVALVILHQKSAREFNVIRSRALSLWQSAGLSILWAISHLNETTKSSSAASKHFLSIKKRKNTDRQPQATFTNITSFTYSIKHAKRYLPNILNNKGLQNM